MLSFSNRRQPQTWVRIQGPGKRYRGDIGLLVEKLNVFPGSASEDDEDDNDNDPKIKKSPLLYLLALPRISLYPTVDRPPARPLQIIELQARPEVSINRDSYGNFHFDEKSFTPDGFWIASLEDVNLLPEYSVLPTSDELNKFKACSLLEINTYHKTATKISQNHMQCYQRVKIVDGIFSGTRGEILSIVGDDAEVYIPSHDCTERTPLASLRMHFEIGDAVRVLAGEHKDFAGWIVAVEHGKAIIARPGDMIEVIVLSYTIY